MKLFSEYSQKTEGAMNLEHRERPRDARGAAVSSEGVLYAWGISPFSYKVQMAAAHAGVGLEVRVASLADCGRAQKQTGKRKTPFLVAGEAWITDSTAICAWIEARPGARSLLPRGERERAECLLLEDWGDEGLNRAAEPWIWMGGGRFGAIHRRVVGEQTHLPSRWAFALARGYMRRLWSKRASAQGSLEAGRALLVSQLDLIERRLAGARWLFGDEPTVADFAIAAQLANLVRFSGAEDLDERSATAAMVRRATSLLPWWTAEGHR